MMVLYTNGKVMVFDQDDKPIEHLQAKLLGQVLHLRRFSSAVDFAKYRFR